MRRLVAVLGLLALAGCGGSSKPSPPATTAPAVPSVSAAMQALIKEQPQLAGASRTLFEGSGWSVVQTTSGGQAHAVVFHLARGRWVADMSGKVKVAILGPQPGAHAPALPQIAIEITAPAPFIQSALWIDGKELLEKGGGSPTRGTIYGAPARSLKAGPHVAVGYARTAKTGSVVAWVFNVS